MNTIWQMLLDGILVERAAHTFSEGKKGMPFTLCVANNVKLNAVLYMRYRRTAYCWQCMLTVNGVEVPVCWSMGGEVEPPPKLPEVPLIDSPEEAVHAEG